MQYSIKAVVANPIVTHRELSKDPTRLKRLGCVLADPDMAADHISLLTGAAYYCDMLHPGYERENAVIILSTICSYTLSGNNAQVEVISELKSLIVSPVEETT